MAEWHWPAGHLKEVTEHPTPLRRDDPVWKYVNIRRLNAFIEASIDHGLQWVVFEPNSEETWAEVRRQVADFLMALWQLGRLVGAKPEDAFFVRCDPTTMTQDDLDNGRLVVLVGFAPLKPAEFEILRIGQRTVDGSHAAD
jgi:uncharacterized protein